MNWLDFILLLPIFIGLVRGLMRGFISEIIAFAVVILGVIGARLAAPPCAQWFLQQFAWPQGICDVAAYTLIFLTVAIILSFIARLLTKFLQVIHLGWINRLLGGLFGACKYTILVLLAVIILDKTNESFHYLDEAPVVKISVVYPQMVNITHEILSFFGK